MPYRNVWLSQLIVYTSNLQYRNSIRDVQIYCCDLYPPSKKGILCAVIGFEMLIFNGDSTIRVRLLLDRCQFPSQKSSHVHFILQAGGIHLVSHMYTHSRCVVPSARNPGIWVCRIRTSFWALGAVGAH